MSKNVAVFVDVANIFYAAKAAGVDIDYVTLLKSATAGRDFVRAYAYTGLDPENENQRQFHAFLARSGYKVVSKDIRKYGDGRIKANLDIELVVDLMRMAEKLDIAVVVSGDGDFAPAIYAVQQQGVRVEVISFRGNTSSDLIDAADVFIDIANVARVEKGARSGRRVAAEGDLSMTEVPDKESGVTPRRRRPPEERGERPERSERSSRRRGTPTAAASEVETPAPGAGLVALPGERLSRGTTIAPIAVQPAAAVEEGLERGAETDEQGVLEEGRRRRRRRGGRGRGRGGRPGEAGELGDAGPTGEALSVEPDTEPDIDFPDEVPTLPQHSGFGSVWDSQIGMPAASRPATASPVQLAHGTDDDLDVEPEVPEYLLAERRQQGRGGRGGRGRSGGYRSAIDRERFGSGSRSGLSRNQPRGGAPRGGRPASAPRASVHAMEPIEQTPGGDPWSEVPPEVQELLRAELARRQTGGREAPSSPRRRAPAVEAREGTLAGSAAHAPSEGTAEGRAEASKPRRTRKRASAADAGSTEPAAGAGDGAPEQAPVAPKARRTRKSAAAAADAPSATTAEARAQAEAVAEEAPKPRRTRKRAPAADTEA